MIIKHMPRDAPRPRWTPGLLGALSVFLLSLMGCAAAVPYLLAAIGGAASGVAGEVVVRHPLISASIPSPDAAPARRVPLPDGAPAVVADVTDGPASDRLTPVADSD